MSSYYKHDRGKNWNYGGSQWKLSRSKIALFQDCGRCFYIDNKLGTARPPGFPFNINSAVDSLFKKEFDVHRAAQTPHPIMLEYQIDVLPFAHADIDEWRENFKGVRYTDPETGMLITGAVDDVWVNTAGELIVVDYKSTSKSSRIETLDEDWHIGYKRQMEVYQWLLRQKGFPVSDTGYFVYANAIKDRDGFNARLDFEVTLIPYTGDASWMPGTLHDIKTCLDGSEIPPANEQCDFCRYFDTRTAKLVK